MDLSNHFSVESQYKYILARNPQLSFAAVSIMLTLLELKGIVKQVKCTNYVRSQEAALGYGI